VEKNLPGLEANFQVLPYKLDTLTTLTHDNQVHSRVVLFSNSSQVGSQQGCAFVSNSSQVGSLASIPRH